MPVAKGGVWLVNALSEGLIQIEMDAKLMVNVTGRI